MQATIFQLIKVSTKKRWKTVSMNVALIAAKVFTVFFDRYLNLPK